LGELINLVIIRGKEKITCRVRRGMRLLQALAEAGVKLELPCGGVGTCGGCRVLLKGEVPPPTPEEERFFSGQMLAEGWRLACQTSLRGDTELHLPGRESRPGTGSGFVEKRRSTHAYAGGPVGAAVDLGTTTLVLTLVDLESGRRLVTVAGLNPQTAVGADLITRIQHALSEEGRKRLQEMLISGINILIEEAAAKGGVMPEQITRVAMAGNSVMHHLFLGLSVESLSRTPFTPVRKEPCLTEGAKAGLAVHPRAEVYLAPLLGGFVGGDAAAALFASGLAARPGKGLLVDLGTNGEIILTGGGRVWAASTAAGPAFEGQGITWGMRAAPGAITGVKIDGTGWQLETLGGVAPLGITGSGLIALVAAFLALGLLTPEGRLKSPGEMADLPEVLRERLQAGANGQEVLIDKESGVTITQKDIRLLQLAKGAVRAAVDSLLDEAEVVPEELDTIMLAGAFGSGLDSSALLRIGLLPRVPAARIKFLGNAALEGAVQALRPESRRELERLAGEVRHIPLGNRENYQEKFVASLLFPDDSIGDSAE
jgi:uncharacterized 2Fe-2S/4Fe-4S cluster protein (DUF4445 family)